VPGYAQSNANALSRVSRIKESWDRATSIGLLGALSLLGGDVSSPDTGLVATADAQEVNVTPPATAKPAAIVTAQAAPASEPSDVAQGAPTPDGNPPPPEAKTDVAAEDEDDDTGSTDDHQGSSTSLQLIEAQLIAATHEPGLHESTAVRIELPEVPLVTPQQAAGADFAGQGITVRGTDLADIIIGTSGADDLSGGGGDDQIHGRGGDDTIRGGGGDDQVSGGSGNDAVKGGRGDDTADGGSGNDCVSGGGGDDVVTGGLGTDWLTGGDGDDCFQFNSFDDSGSTQDTRDHVFDFKQGADKIDLVKINAECIALSNQSLVFAGLADPDSGPGHGQLRYQHLFGNNADEDRTLVELSRGDGHGHMQIELHGLFTMTVDDFLL
jgi:Ca2+-binding RTX toxin-like protein